jgi:hypothetical protein
MPQDSWPVDGAQHHELSDDALYKTHDITQFLSGTGGTILVATKGMGKTILLRLRRKHLVKAGGCNIVPLGVEYDEPRLSGSYPQEGLHDLELWKDLWKASIVLSLLASTTDAASTMLEHFENRLSDTEAEKDIAAVVGTAQKSNDRFLPSFYLNQLLQLPPSRLQRIRRSFYVFDALARECFRSAHAVFIDGLDQSLTQTFHHSIDAWRSAQNGLLLAAHDLNTANSHIRVYATIRQEAWAGFVHDHRAAITNRVVVLQYTTDDLREIFLLAAKLYGNSQSLEDFVGLKSIRNTYCCCDEPVFEYIYRHSIPTPRALMILGKSLYQSLSSLPKDSGRRSEVIREVVNTQSADYSIKDHLLGQMSIFLRTLRSEDAIHHLLSCIPSNILDFDMLPHINRQFAAREGVPEALSHPFCELLNVGLLGRVEQDGAELRWHIKFKKPYEFQWRRHDIIGKRGVFVLHPSLITPLANQRGPDVYFHRQFVVKDAMQWPLNPPNSFLPTIFLSHSSSDKESVLEVKSTLESEMATRFPCQFWIDKERVSQGHRIEAAVSTGLQKSQLLLFFASDSALRSGWVEQEWSSMFQEEIESRKVKIIVVLLHELSHKELPLSLRQKLCVTLHESEAAKMGQSIRGLAGTIAEHLKESVC